MILLGILVFGIGFISLAGNHPGGVAAFVCREWIPALKKLWWYPVVSLVLLVNLVVGVSFLFGKCLYGMFGRYGCMIGGKWWMDDFDEYRALAEEGIRVFDVPAVQNGGPAEAVAGLGVVVLVLWLVVRVLFRMKSQAGGRGKALFLACSLLPGMVVGVQGMILFCCEFIGWRYYGGYDLVFSPFYGIPADVFRWTVQAVSFGALLTLFSLRLDGLPVQASLFVSGMIRIFPAVVLCVLWGNFEEWFYYRLGISGADEGWKALFALVYLIISALLYISVFRRAAGPGRWKAPARNWMMFFFCGMTACLAPLVYLFACYLSSLIPGLYWDVLFREGFTRILSYSLISWFAVSGLMALARWSWHDSPETDLETTGEE